MKYTIALILSATTLLISSCNKKEVTGTYTCQCYDANGNPIVDIPLNNTTSGRARTACSDYSSNAAGRHDCALID